MLAILYQYIKLCCTFLTAEDVTNYSIPAYVQLVPVAIAIVARATPFFESVDSTVRLTATIVEAGTLGTSAGWGSSLASCFKYRISLIRTRTQIQRALEYKTTKTS